jgi:hypothetical protein
MMTVRLLRHDYDYIARRLVPLGPTQAAWTHDERVAMLKRKTRRFTEAEIAAKFRQSAAAAAAARTTSAS